MIYLGILWTPGPLRSSDIQYTVRRTLLGHKYYRRKHLGTQAPLMNPFSLSAPADKGSIPFGFHRNNSFLFFKDPPPQKKKKKKKKFPKLCVKPEESSFLNPRVLCTGGQPALVLSLHALYENSEASRSARRKAQKGPEDECPGQKKEASSSSPPSIFLLHASQ